jgi:hypothetical protein
MESGGNRVAQRSKVMTAFAGQACPVWMNEQQSPERVPGGLKIRPFVLVEFRLGQW